jgi:uncharacterized protein YndB with AHSA1/START domain
MLKTIALVIVVLLVVGVAIVLALAATKPDTFRVQRTATIKASPEKIFPFINDFSKWRAWSPYEKKDPAMKRTFGATTAGKGASYAWEGDKNVGMGSMEITDSSAPSRVGLNLDFLKPFEAHNKVEFTLEPQGDATLVTWDMQGPLPYMFKIMHVFFNMDKMVGTDFEAGLANLKSAVEE